jgi:hypothetical protein
LVGGWTSACVEPINLDRRATPRGSFGEELHRILHKDLVRSADDGLRRGEVFWAYRESFARAIDNAAPQAILSDADAVMARMLPLYDSLLLPGLVRKTALILEEAAKDQALLEAFARFAQLPSYIGQPIRARFLAHVMRYPRLQETVALFLEMFLAHDGRSELGDESDAWIRLLTGMSKIFTDAELDEAPVRLWTVLIDALLVEDPVFADDQAYAALPVVRVDPRGYPLVRRLPDGSLPAPFVDADGDTWADVDDAAQFVLDASYRLEPFGPPGESFGTMARDAQGRLMDTARSEPVFEYIDLHRTPLAFMVRQVEDVVREDLPFDILELSDRLLGPASEQQDELGSYLAYRDDTPLFELLWGVLTLADEDALGPVFEGFAQLLREHPDELALALKTIDELSQVLDAYPDRALSDDCNLLDELLVFVPELMESPELLQDVLAALGDPVTQELGPIGARLLRSRRAFIPFTAGGPYDTCFQSCAQRFEVGTLDRMRCIQACPVEEILGNELTDFDAPESRETISLFQRVFALMWEASETPYALAIDELWVKGANFSSTAQALGNIVVIPNIGEAYLLTLSRDFSFAEHISPSVSALATPLGVDDSNVTEIVLWITRSVFGLEMDANPSTAQVTRFFNQAPLESVDPDIIMSANLAVCKSGWNCVDAHADVLFAMEATGMVDALYPLVSAFTRHGKTALFARILSVVYEHYSHPQTVNLAGDGSVLPFAQSNLRSLEPALVDFMEKTRLLDTLTQLGDVLAKLRLRDGSPFTTALAAYLHSLSTPREGLALANGASSVSDPEGQVISPLAPVYLLLEPLRRLDDVLDEDPESDAIWERVLDGLETLAIQTEERDGVVRFVKPGGPRLAAALVDAIRRLWLFETERAGRSAWIAKTQEDLRDIMLGRTLYASAELYRWMDAQDGAREQIRDIILHTLRRDIGGDEQVTLLSYGLLIGFVHEPSWVALAHFVGAVIDPQRRWEVEGFAELPILIHTLTALDEVLAVDPESVMIELIANGFEPDEHGDWSWETLWNVAMAVNRVNPGDAAPFRAEDYARVLQIVVDFARDDERGFERAYGIIDFALYGTRGRPTR